jgi:hypothetical protein
LIIPNEEVRTTLKQEIDKWDVELSSNVRWTTSLLRTALTGRIDDFKQGFITAFMDAVSSHDIAGGREQLYHMLSLGFFIAGTRVGYSIKSNSEAGLGRYDIFLCPIQLTDGNRAVIFEFKVAAGESKLNDAAIAALQQIHDKHYNRAVPAWCTELIEYGVSFYKKLCLVLARQQVRQQDGTWKVHASDV